MTRSLLRSLVLASLGIASTAQAAAKFTPEEYKKALWMATRFYGGQRSGEGPNWLLIGQSDSLQKSFLKDTYGGQDVSGGWFDCGDHVMFGQTQYWAAYSLAKAYETFPTGFDDLYDGRTYADYKQSGKWNDVNGGTPNGVPDLVDELVYEADYIAKAAISKDAFITLKADPDADHKRWVTAPMMSKMAQTLGGECTSGGEEKYEAPDWTFKGNLTPCTGYATRSIKADKDKAMASNAAAALATIARILDRLGIYPERVKLYTEKARIVYDHATAISGTIAYGMFYSANPNQWDDYVSASLEMYQLTKEQKYLDNAKASEGQVNKGHNWAFSYNNADDMAYFNLYRVTGSTNALTNLKNYATYYKGKINSEGLSEVGDAAWGTLRYPLGAAYSMALADVASQSEANLPAVEQQVDFILGANNAKIAFLVGFKSSQATTTPRFPHHRSVFQRNDNPSDANKAQMAIPEKNQSFGALVANVGFPSTGFKDNVIDYKYSEVCTDYNVGVVGALGYVVSKLAAVDTSKFHGTSVSRTAQHLFSVRRGDAFVFQGTMGQILSNLRILDLRGREVWSSNAASSEISWIPDRAGIYLVKAISGNRVLSTKLTVAN